MVDPTSDPTRVHSEPVQPSMTETALKELAELARDVHSLANGIRDCINLAGKDSQAAWVELDGRVERFREDAERGAQDAVLELRERGFDLKRRLRAFRAKIDPEGEARDRNTRPK